MRKTIPWIAALAIATSSSAHAVDGQIDVAPDGATPSVISASGSYVLVKNVTMTANVDCIQITASNVTLDLNGHTIAGTGAGAADGIDFATNSNIALRNGTIRNFGANGIFGNGNGVAVDELIVSDCLNYGVFLGSGGGNHITNVTARNNTSYGIITTGDSRIENCVATGNNKNGTSSGIRAEAFSIIMNCVANVNKPTVTGAGTGIVLAGRGTIQNCSASGNSGTTTGDGRGIQILDNASVISCVVDGNNGAGTGSGYGIVAGQYCVLSGNVATNNWGGASGGGTGITASLMSAVSGNFCSGNWEGVTGNGVARGIYVQGAVTVVDNICTQNSAQGASGSGIGIDSDAQNGSIFRGNVCFSNNATGDRVAAGINAVALSLIQGNTCTKNLSPGGVAYGIYALSGSVIESNLVADNTGATSSLQVCGIFASADCRIVDNEVRAAQNTGTGGAAGIITGNRSVVSGNEVTGTKGFGSGAVTGVLAAHESTVSGNNVSATSNVGVAIGINAGDNSTVADNHVSGAISTGSAAATGILTGIENLVSGNNSSNNGGSAGTDGVGIRTGVRSSILDNIANSNVGVFQGVGIWGSTICLVQGNSALNNHSATGGAGHAVGIFTDDGSTVRFNTASNSAGNGGNVYNFSLRGHSLVEGNTAFYSLTGATRIGFHIEGTGGTLLRSNMTAGNAVSIDLTSSGNRTEQNRFSDSIVTAVAGNTAGTGDLADVYFF